MSALSRFYDFYDGPEHRDKQFDFYASLCEPDACNLLELASGTGIITIELARRGFTITGIDYDEDMLAIARRKAGQEPAAVQERLEFIHADMKSFSTGRQYGLVFIPTCSFGYLSSFEDQVSCLRHAHDHLQPGGLLVIEERYYSPEEIVHMFNLKGVERTWAGRVNPETGRYTMYKDCTQWVDFAGQTIFRSSFVDEVQEDGSIRRYVNSGGYFGNREHYFTPVELRLLVEKCGFQVADVWGDVSKQPVSSRSKRIIVRAEKGALRE